MNTVELGTHVPRTPAPVWLRSVAGVIDCLVVGIVWYGVIEAWGTSGSAGIFRSATTTNGDKVLSGLPAILLILATGLYWILPEWTLKSTVGKLLCGLQVVSAADGSMSLKQSLKRNVLRLIDFFPFYIPGFFAVVLTANHQRLGDLWAKTLVVTRN